jgi:hypothetical protein
MPRSAPPSWASFEGNPTLEEITVNGVSLSCLMAGNRNSRLALCPHG